jgi:large subunit ribosomal protein L30
MTGQLKVTLKRSINRRPEEQKRTVRAMGFHRLHETRLLPDNPAMRGMIRKVTHLVDWEEVSNQESSDGSQ